MINKFKILYLELNEENKDYDVSKLINTPFKVDINGERQMGDIYFANIEDNKVYIYVEIYSNYLKLFNKYKKKLQFKEN